LEEALTCDKRDHKLEVGRQHSLMNLLGRGHYCHQQSFAT